MPGAAPCQPPINTSVACCRLTRDTLPTAHRPAGVNDAFERLVKDRVYAPDAAIYGLVIQACAKMEAPESFQRVWRNT